MNTNFWTPITKETIEADWKLVLEDIDLLPNYPPFDKYSYKVGFHDALNKREEDPPANSHLIHYTKGYQEGKRTLDMRNEIIPK